MAMDLVGRQGEKQKGLRRRVLSNKEVQTKFQALFERDMEREKKSKRKRLLEGEQYRIDMIKQQYSAAKALGLDTYVERRGRPKRYNRQFVLDVQQGYDALLGDHEPSDAFKGLLKIYRSRFGHSLSKPTLKRMIEGRYFDRKAPKREPNVTPILGWVEEDKVLKEMKRLKMVRPDYDDLQRLTKFQRAQACGQVSPE